MLTDCSGCGTKFAPDLSACPHCGTPAVPAAADEGDGEDEEDGMPKITREGVSFPDGRAEPAAETPELPPPPPVSALKADHVEYATETLGVPAEEAESMTKPELVDLARQDPPVTRPPRRTPPPGSSGG